MTNYDALKTRDIKIVLALINDITSEQYIDDICRNCKENRGGECPVNNFGDCLYNSSYDIANWLSLPYKGDYHYRKGEITE